MHAIRRRRLVEDHLVVPLSAGLAQGRDVVEDPERASVGGHYEVIILDHQIVNWRVWQIQLQGLPVCAIVEGNVDAGFRASIEHLLLAGILSDSMHVRAIGNTVYSLLPRLAKLTGLADIAFRIVQLV